MLREQGADYGLWIRHDVRCMRGAIRCAKSTSVAVKMIGPDASSRRIAPGQYPEIKLQKLQGVSSNGDSRILKVTKVGMCNEGRKAAISTVERSSLAARSIACDESFLLPRR